MTDQNNPFVTGDLLLSVSTCSVIAAQLAEQMAATGGYSTADVLDAIDLPDDPSVLLRAEQVAGLLGLSRDSILDLARRGGDPLPSRKLGRARRFIRAEVDDWVARQK